MLFQRTALARAILMAAAGAFPAHALAELVPDPAATDDTVLMAEGTYTDSDGFSAGAATHVTVFLAEGDTVTGTIDLGSNGTSVLDGNRLWNEGTLQGTVHALGAGSSSASPALVIGNFGSVTNNGTISSTVTADAAAAAGPAVVTGVGVYIANAGTISSTAVADDVTGTATAGTAIVMGGTTAVINSGSILSQATGNTATDGVAVVMNGGGNFLSSSAGLISGAVGVHFVGVDAVNTVSLSGTAVVTGTSGTAILGEGGADAVNITGDVTINGDIDLGGGNDQLYVSGNGVLASDIANVEVMDVTNGYSQSRTLSGVLSGTGYLVKNGSGALKLSGANTYSGGTTVNDGVLQGDTTSLQGDILLYGDLAFSQAFNGAYTGVLSGIGALSKYGAGTVTLSGTNEATGNTTVGEGTLVLAGGQAVADVSAVTVNADGNLVLSASEVIGSLAGAGELDNGGHALTTGGNDTSSTFSGVIAGSGALVKDGNGVFTLTGANTYSGGTSVLAGVLKGNATGLQGNIVNDAVVSFEQATAGTYAGAMSGSGALVKTGAGTLTLTGANSYTGGTTISAGVLKGNSTSLQGAIVDNAALAFDQATDAVFANVVSGTGTVTKLGAGTLTLTAANTWTGATVISDGTLALAGGHALADASAVTVGSGGTLRLDASETIGSLAGSGTVANGGYSLVVGADNAGSTFAGVIGGGGSLVKTGAGTLTLAGANTYTGGTFVNSGGLRGNSASLRGDVVNDATVTFHQVDDGTYSGAMSGTGAFFKSGTGVLTLDGTNTWTGATTVSAGTLEVDGGAALDDATAVTVNAGAVLRLAADETIGSLAGGGSVDTASWVLRAGGDGLDTTFSGSLGGSGGFEKTGNGLMVLSGTHAFDGDTQVASGVLRVNGALGASTVTVHSGARLEGTGTVGGALFSSGSRVSPGTTIGTLSVNGDVTFAAGSAFEVAVAADGTGDRLVATGVAQLDGGTVDVQAGAGNYDDRTEYTILTAGGGVAGEFVGVSTNLAFLSPSLAYAADRVLLRLRRNDVAYNRMATTLNEVVVADALAAVALASPTPDMQALLDDFNGLSAADAQAALATLNGHTAANVGLLARGNRQAVLALMPVRGAVATASGLSSGDVVHDGVVAWGQLGGGTLRVDGDAQVAGFEGDTTAGVLGFDAGMAGDLVLGASMAFARSAVDHDGAGDRVDADSAYLALHAVRERMAVDYDMQLALGRTAFDTRRVVQVGAATAFAQGDTESLEFHARGEVRWRGFSSRFTPVAGLSVSRVDVDGYAERGAGAANLIVGNQAIDSVATHVGIQAGRVYEPARLAFDGRLVWEHDFGDMSGDTTMRFAQAAAQEFVVSGVAADRDAVQAHLRCSRTAGEGLRVYGEYAVEWRPDALQQGLSAGLEFTW